MYCWRTSESTLLVVQRAEECKQATRKRGEGRQAVQSVSVLSAIRRLLFKPDRRDESEQQASPVRRPRTARREGGRQNTPEIDHMGHARSRREGKEERWKIPLLSLSLSLSLPYPISVAVCGISSVLRVRPFHGSDA